MALAGSTGGKVVVDGLGLLQKQVKAVGGDTKDFAKANYAAAQTLRQAALPLVPTYRGNKGENGKLYQYKSPGELKRSLRASRSSRYAEVKLGNARVLYANPIHWGWLEDKEWFIKKNIRPNLFLYRALNQKMDTIMADYRLAMDEIIKKNGLAK